MAITDVVPVIPFMYPIGFGISGFFYPVSQSSELPTAEAVGFLLHRGKLAYPPSLDK